MLSLNVNLEQARVLIDPSHKWLPIKRCSEEINRAEFESIKLMSDKPRLFASAQTKSVKNRLTFHYCNDYQTKYLQESSCNKAS